MGYKFSRHRSKHNDWGKSKTPPKNTAQAKTLIGSSKESEKYNAETINEILSQTGVNAGTINFPYVFNMPPAIDTKDIKKI